MTGAKVTDPIALAKLAALLAPALARVGSHQRRTTAKADPHARG